MLHAKRRCRIAPLHDLSPLHSTARSILSIRKSFKKAWTRGIER
jgi:hypothetical protein